MGENTKVDDFWIYLLFHSFIQMSYMMYYIYNVYFVSFDFYYVFLISGFGVYVLFVRFP